MTTPHAALLPCPFCGGDVSEVTPPGSSVWIECGSCRCKTTRYSAIEGARIAWNRRATSAIAALDAYLASPQPGWVAVPVKPTDAMLDALYAEGDFTSYDGMLSCWRSMLDNLPAPPGQHQGAAPDGAQPTAALSREEIERWRTILRDTFTDGEGEYPPEPDALCDLALLALTSDAARGGEGMSDFEKWQQIGASRHPREWLAANQAAVNAANYCRADLTDKATRELITRVVVHVLDTVLPKAKP